LCQEAVDRIVAVSRGYSNLEYDLAKGERGLRHNHIHDLLCTLTGAEDALAVNNNAAAVLLVLNTISQGKEAIVSRGELIEIGGEFRIPDVMEKSGGRLREVGTTNRTRLKDYEAAIGPETSLIMKVHTSNFRVIGFTEEAPLLELVALGKRYAIPVMDDLGSGCFIDLKGHGLPEEPTVTEVLQSGVDVVTFSGDKLLGGPQAGLILGKRDILAKIKKNPLNRALRIDKLTLAALEATIMQYLHPPTGLEKIQTLKALTEPRASVAKRARRLMAHLRRLRDDRLALSLVLGDAAAGGGSLPGANIPTALVSLCVDGLSASALESRMRGLPVPIIARIENDQVFLDGRTVLEDELTIIRDGLRQILGSL
jgi:L-seryl-tRNA(Ser) seleniumtransferase